MRVTFTNLGCKLNQAEVDEMAHRFAVAGHRIVSSLEEADVHVVNTCTVTHVAARDSRKIARRGHRSNPQIKTVLTGCYVAAEPASAASLAGVDLVVPNVEKENLLEHFHQKFPECVPKPASEPSLPVPYVPLEYGHSRALVKVEDGCNMRCSFCIIPITRGPQRSRSLDEIVSQIQILEDRGYGEVVVTGVQISSYIWEGQGLFDLVSRVLARTKTIRVRLTSIAPWQFDHRLLGLFATGRLCRHFHLSLQSGCSQTLRRMRRPYSTSEFSQLVGSIREKVPSAAITTDIIVGFPGETDQEFADSSNFVSHMNFARIHAFPYSRRHGTAACDLPDQASQEVKRERMHQVLQLAKRSQIAFQDSCLNSVVQVLWEDHSDGTWVGTTDNYLRAWTRASENLQGRLAPAVLVVSGPKGVEAKLVQGNGSTNSPGIEARLPSRSTSIRESEEMFQSRSQI